MFKSVLVTVDLNHDSSWVKALPQAVELVRSSGGILHVLSVVPDFGTPLVEGFFPEDFEEKSVAHASKMLADLVVNQVPEDIKVKQHLSFGKIHRKILKAIDKTKCDIVVMASQDPENMSEYLVGSNADRVVRRSPVSVLVVRA